MHPITILLLLLKNEKLIGQTMLQIVDCNGVVWQMTGPCKRIVSPLMILVDREMRMIHVCSERICETDEEIV